METRIALFQKKEIRKTLHADEWWFVIVDVVAALTDSVRVDAVKGRGQLVPLLCAGVSYCSHTFKGEGQIATPFSPAKESGRNVVSRENYLDAPESVKRLSRSEET